MKFYVKVNWFYVVLTF